MTSSAKRILKGATVDGVVFCHPSGEIESKNLREQQEQDQLKSLEDYWYTKGLQEGKNQGFDKGYAEGKEEGMSKGLRLGQEKGFSLGKEEGLAQGLAQGKEEALESVEEQLQLLEKLVQELNTLQGEVMENSRAEIVRFSTAVAEKLIGGELKDPEIFSRLVSSLVRTARPLIQESKGAVWVHPEDLLLLQDHLDRIRGDLSHLLFEVDESLNRGEFRIEAPLGLVNFDMQRELEGLEQRALEVQVPHQEEGES